MKKNNFYNMFYIFIFSSVFGYIIEGIFTFVKKLVVINHSALIIGPFNFAYGICGILFSLLLYKFKDEKIFKVFIISFIGGTILEYIMSFGMEKVLGFTAWDYSQKFLNINGRVALMYSIFWGFLGVFWIKFLYKWLIKLIEKINYDLGKKIMVFLIIFLTLDGIFTVSALNRSREWIEGIPPQNSYERFLDNTFNYKYLKNMFNNNWG